MSFVKELREELLELKMWDAKSSLKQEDQLARLYLREAFLKTGFINDPLKEYHLEILFKEEDKAESLKNILETFGIKFSTTQKSNDIMVYIKEGEEISSFLALIRC